MDCARVAEHLVAYHLANVTEDEREAVEAHLVDCSSCLKTYLALKRAADRAEHARPRPEVKARLRAEVARTFPSKRAPRVTGALLFRRIPLYQGVALAALAAAIALVAPAVLHRAQWTSHPGTPVDTSRTQAHSLHIY